MGSGRFDGGFSFLDVLELADDHVALGETGDDLEFSAHGGDETPQRADVHVGLMLQLGRYQGRSPIQAAGSY